MRGYFVFKTNKSTWSCRLSTTYSLIRRSGHL